jgi:hypothetical protein
MLHPGELAIYDFCRPYELEYRSAVQLAVFTFPQALLPFSVDNVAALTAISMSGDHGTSAILPSLLRRVAVDLDSFPPASAARLSTVVLDVITTAIAERIDQDAALAPQAQRRTLLLRIHAFIEQHLADPDLSPSVIAAAHHMSSRYLHRLFALDNTTVAGWIRQRRLERCRKDLTDPFLRMLPVSLVSSTRWPPLGAAVPPGTRQLARDSLQRFGLPGSGRDDAAWIRRNDLQTRETRRRVACGSDSGKQLSYPEREAGRRCVRTGHRARPGRVGQPDGQPVARPGPDPHGSETHVRLVDGAGRQPGDVAIHVGATEVDHFKRGRGSRSREPVGACVGTRRLRRDALGDVAARGRDGRASGASGERDFIPISTLVAVPTVLSAGLKVMLPVHPALQVGDPVPVT